MVKAIIFDCFGVLVGCNFWDMYAAAGGDVEKDRQFIHDMLVQSNSGLISQQEFDTQVAKQLGISVETWQANETRLEQPNEALFAYITAELKPKYKIGLLSNANRGGVERRIPAGKRALFDSFVVSGEVGCLKPDREIYQIAVDQLGVQMPEALFIDDIQAYVDAAKSYGMQGVCYHDLASLKKQLAAIN